MTPTLVGTDLDERNGASHSGFVDLIDSRQGVRGWAVNHADPLEPVRLLLFVGEQMVAEIFADGDRADISAKLGRPARAGFAFDPDLMVTLPSFMEDPEDTLTVRVADSGHVLPGAATSPTIGEIIAQLRVDATPEPRSTIADFEFMLDELRAGADTLAEGALRPLPENLQGYIETVAVDTSGQVWFMGWMKRGHVQEFSAVVVERRKYAAAVAVMSYGRDDLPSDSCGVVGLISSVWRPSSATSELHVFFGMGGRFHMRAHAPLRIVTTGELVAEYEGVRDRCFGDGRAIALQRMLTALENWLPTRTAAQWFATECSIDRILLVPGLGCLVEGWVVSPMKRIEGLRLRVGASVMSADPESLYWKPRPDLLPSFPGSSERLVERAGFVGLFAGDAEPEDFADPVLKVIFQGGSSANWSIAATAFRRLGHSAGVEDALMFFPALQEEAFFPRFAEAAIRAERSAMNAPVVLSVQRSRRVMMFVLPEDRCDLFLLFEELTHQCRTIGGIEAVAFIAASKSHRSDALWLFREFQAGVGAALNIACSLLVIDDAAQAFALLPDLLREVGANRFFFAGAGVFLKESGWARARQALIQGATDLVFFGMEAEEYEEAHTATGVTGRCFAWSTGHLARWALGAPSFMGGFYRDNGLFQSRSAHVVHHNAASATRTLLSTRVQEAVNSTVYALTGQHGGIAAAHVASPVPIRSVATGVSRPQRVTA